MEAFLQMSWFAASLSIDTLRPDQAPTPLPEGSTWVAGVEVPVIEYHAGRQPATLVADTVAVTAPTVTAAAEGLSKVPDRG